MADVGAPQVALELGDQFELAFLVLVRRNRRKEIARAGQAVAADRAEVGQAQVRAEVLAYVAARRAVGQRHRKAHAARDHRDLLRFDLEHAQLRSEEHTSELQSLMRISYAVICL